MGVVDAISSFIITYYPWYGRLVEKANLRTPTSQYIKLSVKISLYLFTILLVLSSLYFLSYIPTQYSGIFINFIIFLPLSIIAFLLTISGFMIYPVVRKVSLSNRLDKNLLNLVAFLYSMSASGSGLDDVFERVVESFGRNDAFPFAQYLYYRNVLGWDVSQSLKRVAERCPNEELSNIFSTLSHSVLVSENLTPVLETLYSRLMEIRRLDFAKKINSLSLLAEIFISSMVVLPVLAITILTIVAMVGASIFGVDPSLMTAMIVYLLVPIALVFIVAASVGEWE